ncbi:hypothetical protein [Bdellovibrio bacteriovorus]|uniref:YtkA-like domain-containing protein n=1 Tax=Bdellovibrio bacteriovorus TaxID=959 RepID=A0A1Z3N7V5_BDEBC|nr:hypothetical protein [Bdellovibrio bacteriovorus]ASD63527.1 hypothetical protein B9G79_08055 [Bdellovibrio bacteriovorus]
MKRTLKSLILLASLTLSPVAMAHEGHDVPGTLKAQHGGIPKTGKLFNMEMLAIETKVQFFPRAHEGESLDTKNIKISGTAKSPKGKAAPLQFTANANSFDTTVDFQGSHRVNLEIKVDYEGKSDTFKFLVEK